MNFAIITYGCQMNAADSQWLARSLTARGMEESGLDDADLVVLNTCSVRDKPEQKVYSELGRLEHRYKGNSKPVVAVGGCVAQQVGANIMKRFPRVRLVFGTDGLAMTPDGLERILASPDLRLSLTDFCEDFLERDLALSPDQKTGPSAFVTIMQGCDNFCSYCIVPFVRGRQKSRTAKDVLAEVRALAGHGAREITLLGQNVNSYGQDKTGDGTSFPQLLRQVAAVDGIQRIRFTTSHPKDLSPELIAAFGDLEALCPRLHLPVQSGSDAVLERMGRKYDRAHYIKLVRDLHAARPDMKFSTDFIVGFPGESEDDFAATLTLLDEIGYMHSFFFKYSDRPGARAAKYGGKLEESVKAERLARLQTLQDEKTSADLAAQVGKNLPVLIEGGSKHQNKQGFSWRGRDPWGRTVNLPGPATPDLTGTILPVTIRLAKQHSLYGEMEGAR